MSWQETPGSGAPENHQSYHMLLPSLFILIEFLIDLQNKSRDANVKNILTKLIEKASFQVKDEENVELKNIEKRIFEYVLFIEKDINNNAFNNFLMNAEKLEKLLDKRGKY